MTKVTIRVGNDNACTPTYLENKPQSHSLLSLILPSFPGKKKRKKERTMLDPATRLLENRANLSDHIGRINGSYDSYDALNYGDRARKTAQNYANSRSWNSMGAATFEGETLKDDDESGVSTPPLWRTSPPASPQHRASHYRSLSPSSRTQAIARGQRELMEMVSKMPESCYELSLRDLVERPVVEAKQERLEEEKSIIINNENMCKKKKMVNDTKKVIIKRSESIDNGGLLLKLVFPISFGSKKKKKNKNDSVANNSSKVSPKPPVPDGSSKGVDKDWWKKRFSVSSESENGGSSSTNSGSTKSSGSNSRSSSTRSNSRNGSGGCWSFITIKKSKSAE